MTFTNMLKALGLLNNGPAPEQCYNPNSTRGTPAPTTSKGYNHPGYSPPPPPPPLPNVVNGYPVNNNYTPNPAPNAYYYYYPTQPAPTNPSEISHDNVTTFVPHGHDISEGLKPPNAYDNSSSIAGPDQPANSKSRISTCANPQLPKSNGKVDKHKNIGEKNGKKKNGKKKSSRSSGDSFKVHGNTINGGKGDKVGVFDFGNKYSRGGKKRDEEEEDSTEEETDSGTEDERD
ncbi:PREDICTED: circumsporozoite-like isoform X2 [Prunus dulcis]|uniref:PREDICTED: circumsporozoite-like isoform X2 n=1 Tax=Prunus dulcis TaxID=3755 RepID=A0A5E4F9Z7_PRUDU|nr:neural Wiskott-Aldrich syndrome protein-like [Prunus dulcis]KAI5349274.1 hypothetical protein L3X38_002161 [Prunus dulcis]VVA24612.1 PREDICTED: circumsporozoite-like isoform X2 [Prunus dulcis]